MTPATDKRTLMNMVTPMDKLLNMLLSQPERFDWSSVPCSMLGVLEVAHDDASTQPEPHSQYERYPRAA